MNQETRPRYEPPKNTLYSVLQWTLINMGILVGALIAVIVVIGLMDRLLTQECYDKTGAYDDTCSQGVERTKTP